MADFEKVFEVAMQVAHRFVVGSLKQVYMRMPMGIIVQFSKVEDATWEGLQEYARENPTTVEAHDFSDVLSTPAEPEAEGPVYRG